MGTRTFRIAAHSLVRKVRTPARAVSRVGVDAHDCQQEKGDQASHGDVFSSSMQCEVGTDTNALANGLDRTRPGPTGPDGSPPGSRACKACNKGAEYSYGGRSDHTRDAAVFYERTRDAAHISG